MNLLRVALSLAGLLLVALSSGLVSEAVADETADVSPDAAGPPEMRSTGERFTFQAEVNRLMDIIIHSLYSNKDIFLRELISNASDALDKLRLLALSDASLLGASEDEAALEIRLSVDPGTSVLRIRDRGIGMTKDELVKNLGTIAKSGTSSFLEKMQASGDANLIGQFGVGFYSVYLVSDYVEVISKAPGQPQYIWESTASGEFVVSEDAGGTVSGEGDIGRGTMLRIHLKEEHLEYAQEARLRELVQKYSEFINFPIYLLSSKTVEIGDDEDDGAGGEEDEDEEEEEEDGGEKDEEDGASEDGIGDEEEAEDVDEAAKAEKRTEVVQEWELLNGNKALWLRNPAEVEEAEYSKFYSALAREEGGEPTAHVHFKAEGDVEFRSILYVPARAPWDFYDTYYSRKPSVRLYVRRVFISDQFEELLPRYLSFLLGLVDSDTLPLNVSREMLQQHSSLRTIKKKLVRKALEMIKKLAEAETKGRKYLDASADETDEETEKENEEEKEEGKADTREDGGMDKGEAEKAVKKYEGLWNEFGKALKLGVIEDANNRMRLAKLLRFYTTASPDKLTSLDAYVSRMKEGQKQLFYLCGGSMDEVQRSPFLERLLEAGYEVILFTEPMDEYMMQNLLDYDDLRFQNASKEDLKLSDDEESKKLEKKQREMFKPLTKWWRKLLGDDGGLEAIRVSNRLANTPCVIVTSKYGWSANMQRIMQAQALGDSQRQAYMQGKRTMEINARHPLIVKLLESVQTDEESAAAADTARLLYETALLESGYPMMDQQAFASRVYKLMKEQLGLERDLTDLHPEIELDASDLEQEVKGADKSADKGAQNMPEADGIADEL